MDSVHEFMQSVQWNATLLKDDNFIDPDALQSSSFFYKQMYDDVSHSQSGTTFPPSAVRGGPFPQTSSQRVQLACGFSLSNPTVAPGTEGSTEVKEQMIKKGFVPEIPILFNTSSGTTSTNSTSSILFAHMDQQNSIQKEKTGNSSESPLNQYMGVIPVKSSKKKSKTKRLSHSFLVCKFCDSEFTDQNQLQDHLEWHAILCGNISKSESETDNVLLKEYVRTLDLDSISCELVERKFNVHKLFLENIMLQKIHCDRHKNFHQSQGRLQYANVCLCLNQNNLKHLLRLMGDNFCKNDEDNRKKIDYFLKVLLPEFLIKLFMDMYSISYTESYNMLVDLNVKIDDRESKKTNKNTKRTSTSIGLL